MQFHLVLGTSGLRIAPALRIRLFLNVFFRIYQSDDAYNELLSKINILFVSSKILLDLWRSPNVDTYSARRAIVTSAMFKLNKIVHTQFGSNEMGFTSL